MDGRITLKSDKRARQSARVRLERAVEKKAESVLALDYWLAHPLVGRVFMCLLLELASYTSQPAKLSTA